MTANTPRRHALTAWLLAAALSAACSDNLPTVAPSAMPPDAGTLMDDKPAEFASHAGDVIDNFTPRLDLTIRVVGALAPNSLVVLELEATANEAISAGTIDLVLPTMAGLAYNGPDRHPRFPPSNKMPTIGSWTLSQLARGAHWKQNVSIRLPDKGYYQVAVDVRTTGPDPLGMGPYLIDDTHEQAWMLVVESGGSLTRQFEDSVFPDRIAPQPGPFRVRPGSQSRAQPEARSARSSPSHTWLEFVYYDGSRYVPAEGTYASGKLYGQADSTRRTTSWRVPRNGTIRLPCAPPFQYWRGSAALPGSTYARGTVATYYWDAEPHECGDTIQVNVPRALYLSWSYLNEVIPRINSHFGFSRPAVAWQVNLTQRGSHFSPQSDAIMLGRSYIDKWVVAHEYGHALQHLSLGGLWNAHNCRDHFIFVPSSYTCAFLEGLADYAGSIGAPRESAEWGGSYENVRASPRPAETEGNVAALLRDLIDTTNEYGDRTTYSARYVFEVFKTCVSGGAARNDVTDFVWCLENRVDATVHRTNFPTRHVPSSVAERASEPLSWNADHIRSTWLKNVGR